jgi:hypothetical protein
MPNMKKAIIDQMLLGLFLMALVLVTVATVADQLKVKNEFYDLKKTLQVAVLSASKYYINENDNTTEAQNIALGIIEQTTLGASIKNDINFTWNFVDDPNYVTASITSHTVDTFWFRLIDLDNFTFTNVEAKANILATPSNRLPQVDEANDFMPFAINECGQDNGIIPGDSLSFIYKAYDQFESNDSLGFYGLDDEKITGTNQSSFAHFKNTVDLVYEENQNNFNRLTTPLYLVNSVYDPSQSTNPINNDASQLASSLEVHKYDTPTTMSVGLIDCASTKDSIIISNIISVSLDEVYCGDKHTSDDNIDSAFVDQTGDVFTDVTWVEWEEGFDCSKSGLFRIDLSINIPNNNTVILEY